MTFSTSRQIGTTGRSKTYHFTPTKRGLVKVTHTVVFPSGKAKSSESLEELADARALYASEIRQGALSF